MPQESFLFTGTIRDNIAYGRPEATDAEVEAAARAVGAHDFIASLPDGYHHPVTERGALAVVGSAAADRPGPRRAGRPGGAAARRGDLQPRPGDRGEGRRPRWRRVAGRRTTILIAHRLQTARTADRIVVLASGQVVEEGTHEELVDRDGRYAAMWRAFELVSAS